MLQKHGYQWKHARALVAHMLQLGSFRREICRLGSLLYGVTHESGGASQSCRSAKAMASGRREISSVERCVQLTDNCILLRL